MLYIVATTLFIIVNLRLPNLEEIRISQGTRQDPLYPVLPNWKNS
jgi:hypothetical protein